MDLLLRGKDILYLNVLYCQFIYILDKYNFANLFIF